MSMPDLADLQKLKSFIEFVESNPTILNLPQLEFFKTFIEQFGGKIPEGTFEMPTEGKCPFSGAAGSPPTAADTSAGTSGKRTPHMPETEDVSDPEEEVEMDSEEPESEVELDMEGVIDPDSEADQSMGDSSKEPTEEEIEQASELRSKAAAAYAEQKYQEAIDLYTQAIELNPGNALFHAKRGQAFLKLQKPNACIRDCDKALELNCDSAAAYKFRGRAHRLLGNWEASAHDLRQACKIDFDEEADEWLREVTPNAKKLEQHRIKYERKKVEQRIRRAQEANRKAREEQAKQQSSTGGSFPGGSQFPGSGSGHGFGGGGFPGNFTGGEGGGFNINDFLSGVNDPEVAAALQDIAQNPHNIGKYRNHPKMAKLMTAFKNMAGKEGFPGFPGGFPGSPSSSPASPDAAADAGTAPTGASGTPSPQGATAAEEPKAPEPKKPDFVDDGLD